MPNINFKTLQSLFATMLTSIVEPPVFGGDQYQRVRSFAGDQSTVTLLKAGTPVLTTTPDPNANLGSSFSLVDDGYDAYETFVDELTKDDIIGRQVGRKALEQEIEGLLRTFRSESGFDGDKINLAIRNAVKRLRGLVKSWRVIVPVDNLELRGLTEVVVGRVTLRPTSSIILQMLQHAMDSVDLSSSPDIEKQGTKQSLWELFSNQFGKTKTVAELSVEAEQSRLSSLADNEVDAALNVLRCYMTLIFPRDQRNFIGLRGEVVSMWRPCLSMGADVGEWNVSLQQVGGFAPYLLTVENLAHLKKNCAFDTLSIALTKRVPPPTEIESALLVASRWLGRGVVATDNAEKVLNLMVSLERLICAGTREVIAETLAQRMTFLIGKDFKARQHVLRRIKKLYGLRSKVVHEGNTDIAEDDVKELEDYACAAFIAMAERAGEWQQFSDFTEWVEYQIVALPADQAQPAPSEASTNKL